MVMVPDPSALISTRIRRARRRTPDLRPLSGLCHFGADLGVGHGTAVEIPGTVDGMNDVDEDLVSGLPATGHFMDDVGRFLEIALLNLPIREGEGRHFPFDEGD